MNQHEKINQIIFFDGYCNLCSNLISFLIKRNKYKKLTFLSLQSTFANEILSSYGYTYNQISTLDSVIYLIDDKLKIKSDAILRILFDLKGFYRLSILIYIFPQFIRNTLYNMIAKRRYGWFGMRSECMLGISTIETKKPASKIILH